MHFLDKISWYIRINIFLCPHYLTSYSCQYTSLIMTIFDFFLFAIILKLKLKYVFFPPLANGFNFCNSDLFYILFFLHLAKRYSFHFCSFLCVHVLHQLPGSLTTVSLPHFISVITFTFIRLEKLIFSYLLTLIFPVFQCFSVPLNKLKYFMFYF